MTTRRGFLLQCLALGAAPAVVKASSIMRVAPKGWQFGASGVLERAGTEIQHPWVADGLDGPYELWPAATALAPVYDIVTDALYVRRGGAWHRLAPGEGKFLTRAR